MEKILRAILQLLCNIEEKFSTLMSTQLSVSNSQTQYLQQTISFSSIPSGEVVLQPNQNRIGIIVANRSADDVFISFDQNSANANFFAIPIATLTTDFFIPSDSKIMYKGQVRLAYKDATGFATVTEISY